MRGRARIGRFVRGMIARVHKFLGVDDGARRFRARPVKEAQMAVQNRREKLFLCKKRLQHLMACGVRSTWHCLQRPLSTNENPPPKSDEVEFEKTRSREVFRRFLHVRAYIKGPERLKSEGTSQFSSSCPISLAILRPCVSRKRIPARYSRRSTLSQFIRWGRLPPCVDHGIECAPKLKFWKTERY